MQSIGDKSFGFLDLSVVGYHLLTLSLNILVLKKLLLEREIQSCGNACVHSAHLPHAWYHAHLLTNCRSDGPLLKLWNHIIPKTFVGRLPCCQVISPAHLSPFGAAGARPGTPLYLSSLSVLNVICTQNSLLSLSNHVQCRSGLRSTSLACSLNAHVS